MDPYLVVKAYKMNERVKKMGNYYFNSIDTKIYLLYGCHGY